MHRAMTKVKNMGDIDAGKALAAAKGASASAEAAPAETKRPFRVLDQSLPDFRGELLK